MNNTCPFCGRPGTITWKDGSPTCVHVAKPTPPMKRVSGSFYFIRRLAGELHAFIGTLVRETVYPEGRFLVSIGTDGQERITSIGRFVVTDPISDGDSIGDLRGDCMEVIGAVLTDDGDSIRRHFPETVPEHVAFLMEGPLESRWFTHFTRTSPLEKRVEELDKRMTKPKEVPADVTGIAKLMEKAKEAMGDKVIPALKIDLQLQPDPPQPALSQAGLPENTTRARITLRPVSVNGLQALYVDDLWVAVLPRDYDDHDLVADISLISRHSPEKGVVKSDAGYVSYTIEQSLPLDELRVRLRAALNVDGPTDDYIRWERIARSRLTARAVGYDQISFVRGRQTFLARGYEYKFRFPAHLAWGQVEAAYVFGAWIHASGLPTGEYVNIYVHNHESTCVADIQLSSFRTGAWIAGMMEGWTRWLQALRVGCSPQEALRRLSPGRTRDGRLHLRQLNGRLTLSGVDIDSITLPMNVQAPDIVRELQDLLKSYKLGVMPAANEDHCLYIYSGVTPIYERDRFEVAVILRAWLRSRFAIRSSTSVLVSMFDAFQKAEQEFLKEVIEPTSLSVPVSEEKIMPPEEMKKDLTTSTLNGRAPKPGLGAQGKKVAMAVGGAMATGAKIAAVDEAGELFVDILKEVIPDETIVAAMLETETGRNFGQLLIAMLIHGAVETAPAMFSMPGEKTVSAAALSGLSSATRTSMEITSYKLLKPRLAKLRPQILRLLQLGENFAALGDGETANALPESTGQRRIEELEAELERLRSA